MRNCAMLSHMSRILAAIFVLLTCLTPAHAQSNASGTGNTSSSSSGSLGSALNVKTYGAIGDAQQVVDASWSGTGPTLNSATASFKSSDVGKIIWCNNNATGAVSWPQ